MTYHQLLTYFLIPMYIPGACCLNSFFVSVKTGACWYCSMDVQCRIKSFCQPKTWVVEKYKKAIVTLNKA